MATLQNTTINDTEFLRLAKGNTAQRPSNPQQGEFRYNTDTKTFEVYSGSEWIKL